MCSSEKLGSHHGQFDNMPLVSNSLNDDKQQISAGTGLNRNPQPVTLVALQSTWPHGAAIETIFKDLSYGGSQKSRLDNRMVSRTPSWTSNSTSNWRQIGLWPSLKHHLGCLVLFHVLLNTVDVKVRQAIKGLENRQSSI